MSSFKNSKLFTLTSLLSNSIISSCFSLFFKCAKKRIMENNTEVIKRAFQNCDWNKTIITLNSFQNNADVLKESSSSNIFISKTAWMIFLLNDLGITAQDLDQLNVIHIAGTKGKGSTCAYIESILRHKGYKTGLYTSPHLITVLERIRINGLPLSQAKFIKYFWEVYNKLNANKTNYKKPGYFMFLTALGFYTFLHEKVDVLILETGIGGQHDYTNIVPNPVTVGITSLGLDHTDILGNTIESIAWNKAGIFKPNVPAHIVNQPNGAMEVIKLRAKEISCPLFIAPSIDAYEKDISIPLSLGIEGDAQKINASLALQLVETWIQKTMKKEFYNINLCTNPIYSKPFKLKSSDLLSLKQARLPGRCQTFVEGKIHYFVDGAHTIESIINCANWFKSKSKNNNDGKVIRILLFNIYGNRDFFSLISPLLDINFDIIINSPNHIDVEQMCDSENFTTDVSTSIEKNKAIFEFIHTILVKKGWLTKNLIYFNCLRDAFKYLNDFSCNEKREIHLLVTGSLHLVGNVLKLIRKDLSFCE